MSAVANPLKRVAPGVGETRNVKQSRSSVSVFSDISESGSSVTLTAASIDADAEEEGQLQASLRHTDFAEDPFENHFVEDVVKVSSEVKKDEKDSFQTVSAVSANSLGPAGLDSSWETNSLIHHNDNPSVLIYRLLRPMLMVSDVMCGSRRGWMQHPHRLHVSTLNRASPPTGAIGPTVMEMEWTQRISNSDCCSVQHRVALDQARVRGACGKMVSFRKRASKK